MKSSTVMPRPNAPRVAAVWYLTSTALAALPTSNLWCGVEERRVLQERSGGLSRLDSSTEGIDAIIEYDEMKDGKWMRLQSKVGLAGAMGCTHQSGELMARDSGAAVGVAATGAGGALVTGEGARAGGVAGAAALATGGGGGGGLGAGLGGAGAPILLSLPLPALALLPFLAASITLCRAHGDDPTEDAGNVEWPTHPYGRAPPRPRNGLKMANAGAIASTSTNNLVASRVAGGDGGEMVITSLGSTFVQYHDQFSTCGDVWFNCL